MVTQQEYDRAVKAIQFAKEKPDKISADTLETLVGVVKEYRGQGLDRSETMGEGPMLSVPGAEKALAQMPMNEPEPPKKTGAERYRAREKTRPEVDYSAPLDEMEEQIGAQEKWRQENFDPAAPNATGRRDVPPPEYLAPSQPVPDISLAHPLDAAAALSTKLDNAMSRLPKALGGKVEHYYEPTIEEFRKNMAPLLGEHVFDVNDTSPEFAEYKDLRWAEVRENAVQQGRSVVRHAFAEDKGSAHHITAELSGRVGALGSGYERGFSGGILGAGLEDTLGAHIDPKASTREELARAFPVEDTLGEAVGLISPRGIASRGAGLVEKVFEKTMGPAKGYVSRMARGSLAGGAGAATGSAAMDVGHNLSEFVNKGDGRTPDYRGAEEIGDRAKIAALLGLPLGMAGGAIRAHGEGLRESTPLGQVGKMGKTSVISGIKPTPQAADIRARARAERVSPEELIADELTGPMGETARAERADLVTQVGRANQAGYEAFGGKKLSYDPILSATTNAHAEVHGKPFAGGQPRLLRQQIAEMADIKLVPKGGSRSEQLARVGQKGAVPKRVYTVDRARALGYDVDRALQNESLGGAAEGDLLVEVTPRSLDARGLDTVTRLADQMQKGQKGGLHQFDKIQAAVRDVHRQLPPEWEAMKERAAQAFSDLEMQHELAGLSGKIDKRGLTAAQYKALSSNVKNYGKGQPVEQVRATRRLAEKAGKGRELEKIPELSALDELLGMAPISSSIRLGPRGVAPSTFSATPLRLRADALLGGVAPRLGNLGASQATIDQISAMLELGNF